MAAPPFNRIDEVLAPFVTASYNKHRKTAEEWNIPDAEGYANSRTIKECYDAFQSLEYEVNTLHTAKRSDAVCNLWFLVWAPAGNRA
ncbi:Anaerobic ribonucleoside-triphosphate reductase [Escherichia coli]|uniref:Anaerobic ribonucleoside-triphosphate reductase n=1 Tax=Escherichia coli TaxID=562 RepID=A0A2X3JRT0_ECOLX|nr:Anaerobic ribonucleoside-triphosphate reductase [Escherichia coli]